MNTDLFIGRVHFKDQAIFADPVSIEPRQLSFESADILVPEGILKRLE